MADLASSFFEIIGKVNASNRKSGGLCSSPDSSFDDLDKRDGRVLPKMGSSTSRQTVVVPVTNSLPLPNSVTEVHCANMPGRNRINDQVVLQINGHSKNDDDNDESMDMINVSRRSINSCKATDDDIYDDLESSIFALGTKEDRIANTDLEEKLVQAEEKIRSLLEENTKLAKENKNYCKNISSLEITARSEIKKKNFIIQQLQSKLQNMTTTLATKSNLTKGEVEEILRQCHEAHIEANSEVIIEEITKFIEQLTCAKPKTNGYKKQYKFGNMSLYLFREQVPFEREGRTVQLESSQEVSHSQGTTLDFPASQTSHASDQNSTKNSKSLQVDKPRHHLHTSSSSIENNTEKLPRSNNENKSKERRPSNTNSNPYSSRSKSPPPPSRGSSSRHDHGRSLRSRSPRNFSRDNRYSREFRYDKDKRNDEDFSPRHRSSNTSATNKRKYDKRDDFRGPRNSNSSASSKRKR